MQAADTWSQFTSLSGGGWVSSWYPHGKTQTKAEQGWHLPRSSTGQALNVLFILINAINVQ